MAKINQVKLRQEADSAEKAGRFDKAVDALKQIVQENPRDWNTVNRIGDLYGKLNNARAANEQYVKVARYFADDGFYLVLDGENPRTLQRHFPTVQRLISLLQPPSGVIPFSPIARIPLIFIVSSSAIALSLS